MTRTPFALALIVPLQILGCRSTPEAGTPTYATRTSPGEVSFELTPRMHGTRLIVNVHSDTHSGDLSQLDLAKVFALDAGGKTYEPAETRPMAGHHADGFVAFEVGSAPSSFSLTISGVRSSPQVKLEWP